MFFISCISFFLVWFLSLPLFLMLILFTVIRSALHAVCAIENMSTSSESRVFNEYKEQWMKRDEVRNMWHSIRSEVNGGSSSSANMNGSKGANEGKSNRK